MRLPFELALLLAPLLLAAPLAPRAASFPHLTGLTSSARDLSTTDGRWPSKYFHESVYHPHYDGRFAAAVQPRAARLLHMRLLLRSYVAAMAAAGVRTWVMHGSLLGWWWSGGVFPWDSDLDFCVDERGVAELGAWWNMTVHSFSAGELGLVDAKREPFTARWRGNGGGSSGSSAPDPPRGSDSITEPPGLKQGLWDELLLHGKKYLLEVNPHASNPSTADPHNKIDARWIDTATGLFIDITTVHPVPQSATAKSAAKHLIFLDEEDTAGPAGADAPDEMYTKDTHLYTTAALFPLRQTRFEGADVWVPYAYEQLLVEEYGPRALVETWFAGWAFEEGAWVRVPEGGDSKEKGNKGEDKTVAASPEEDRLRSEKDNSGGEVYVPHPGRKGEVHTVPGSR